LPRKSPVDGGVEAAAGNGATRLPGARVPTPWPMCRRRHVGRFPDDLAPSPRSVGRAGAPRIAKSNARHRDI